MHDPLEGVAADGSITTGVRRDRVPAAFEPVLADAASMVRALGEDVSLYLYGSVATGQACVPSSDVDLLVVGASAADVAARAEALTARYRSQCRGVEVAGAAPDDLVGEGDEAYGNRVFLRHYAVHLSGPVVAGLRPAYPADARAARGFNGDIARHAARWADDLRAGADPLPLARRVARKTLLAVAGLVSVHDVTWTTDRTTAAHRWAALEPAHAPGLRRLLTWTDDPAGVGPADVAAALDGTVAHVAEAFLQRIGLWSA